MAENHAQPPSRRSARVLNQLKAKESLIGVNSKQAFGTTLLTLLTAPLERIRIILQVKDIAKFANPKDKPKNFWHLVGLINQNQGPLAFFRGVNAHIYWHLARQASKYIIFE